MTRLAGIAAYPEVPAMLKALKARGLAPERIPVAPDGEIGDLSLLPESITV